MKTLSVQDLDFSKGNGLIPVVAQDFESKSVLMLAYVNEEALKKTLESGCAHYWSRSRGKLWMKGETSGNVQRVKEIMVDCDCDALLFLVKQKGNVCHTGRETCFHNKLRGARCLQTPRHVNKRNRQIRPELAEAPASRLAV